MVNYLRQTNITLIIFMIIINCVLLFLSGITVGYLATILHDHTFPCSAENYILLIFATVKGFLSAWLIYYLGMRAMYFKMRSYFVWYMTALFLNFFMSLFIVIFKVCLPNTKRDDANTHHYKELAFVIEMLCIVLMILYVCSVVFAVFYRKSLDISIDNTPLNQIDDPEFLSDEIYKNIIEQSKNPDDEILKNQYRRLSKDKTGDSSSSNMKKNTINDSTVY